MLIGISPEGEGEGEAAEAERTAEVEEGQDPGPLEEIDCEDRILAVPTQGGADAKGEAYQIYVVHQLAQRLLREQIAREFKDFLGELSVLDEEEMLAAVDKEAEQFEKDFFAVLHPDLPVFDFEKN